MGCYASAFWSLLDRSALDFRSDLLNERWYGFWSVKQSSARMENAMRGRAWSFIGLSAATSPVVINSKHSKLLCLKAWKEVLLLQFSSNMKISEALACTAIELDRVGILSQGLKLSWPHCKSFWLSRGRITRSGLFQVCWQQSWGIPGSVVRSLAIGETCNVVCCVSVLGSGSWLDLIWWSVQARTIHWIVFSWLRFFCSSMSSRNVCSAAVISVDLNKRQSVLYCLLFVSHTIDGIKHRHIRKPQRISFFVFVFVPLYSFLT